jgi:hypothetical protein
LENLLVQNGPCRKAETYTSGTDLLPKLERGEQHTPAPLLW